MSIKDLTEVFRAPRLGKIHLGTRHPEKGYPMKADHFIFPKDSPDYQRMVKLYGETPKELNIVIPMEDEEEWATQYYKSYNQTYGLVCKGDGEAALRMVDVKTRELPVKDKAGTVELKEIPCEGKVCPLYKDKKCHEVMNLKFMLPEIPGLGVWQIDTGSINSILNINSCAKIIKRAFGHIAFIPLKLTFEPVSVNNPQDGKKQTVYVLNLRTDVTIAQLAEKARDQARQLSVGAMTLEHAFEVQVEKDIEELWGKKDEPEPIQEVPEAQNSEVKTEGSVIPPEPAKKASKTKSKQEDGIPDFKTAVELWNFAMAHGKSVEGIKEATGCAYPRDVVDLKAAIKALYPEKGV